MMLRTAAEGTENYKAKRAGCVANALASLFPERLYSFGDFSPQLNMVD